MKAANSVQGLRVWQKAMDLVVLCHRVTGTFPADERFGLVSQVRRSAFSIPANIAQGFGRWNSREFGRFLSIASGSARELETHLLIAARLGFLSQREAAPLLAAIDEVARMLFAMLSKIQSRAAKNHHA